MISADIVVTPGDSIPLVVGSQGTLVSNGSNQGIGESSTFGSYLTAIGGGSTSENSSSNVIQVISNYRSVADICFATPRDAADNKPMTEVSKVPDNLMSGGYGANGEDGEKGNDTTYRIENASESYVVLKASVGKAGTPGSWGYYGGTGGNGGAGGDTSFFEHLAQAYPSAGNGAIGGNGGEGLYIGGPGGNGGTGGLGFQRIGPYANCGNGGIGGDGGTSGVIYTSLSKTIGGTGGKGGDGGNALSLSLNSYVNSQYRSTPAKGGNGGKGGTVIGFGGNGGDGGSGGNRGLVWIAYENYYGSFGTAGDGGLGGLGDVWIFY